MDQLPMGGGDRVKGGRVGGVSRDNHSNSMLLKVG